MSTATCAKRPDDPVTGCGYLLQPNISAQVKGVFLFSFPNKRVLIIQGGFFNWPPPPHARLNRAPVHGLAVHEEGGAS